MNGGVDCSPFLTSGTCDAIDGCEWSGTECVQEMGSPCPPNDTPANCDNTPGCIWNEGSCVDDGPDGPGGPYGTNCAGITDQLDCSNHWDCQWGSPSVCDDVVCEDITGAEMCNPIGEGGGAKVHVEPIPSVSQEVATLVDGLNDVLDEIRVATNLPLTYASPVGYLMSNTIPNPQDPSQFIVVTQQNWVLVGFQDGHIISLKNMQLPQEDPTNPGGEPTYVQVWCPMVGNRKLKSHSILLPYSQRYTNHHYTLLTMTIHSQLPSNHTLTRNHI